MWRELSQEFFEMIAAAHIHLPATFTRQFQALLQNTSTLLISGSDDHALFLWSLSPSSLVNTNTKNPPLQHAQTATDTKYPTSNSHQMIKVIRAYYATLKCLLHSAGHWVRDCPPYKYARVHAYSTAFRGAACFHMPIKRSDYVIPERYLAKAKSDPHVSTSSHLKSISSLNKNHSDLK